VKTLAAVIPAFAGMSGDRGSSSKALQIFAHRRQNRFRSSPISESKRGAILAPAPGEKPNRSMIGMTGEEFFNAPAIERAGAFR
jgi:hypothetical protein